MYFGPEMCGGGILMRVTSVVVGTVPYALGKSYYLQFLSVPIEYFGIPLESNKYTQLGLLQHECCMAVPLDTREALAGPSVSYDPVCFQSFTGLSCFGVTSVLSTLSVSTDDVR